MGLILGIAIEMAMLGGATMRVYNRATRGISLIAMLFGVALSAFFNTANAIEVYGLTVAAVVEGAGVVLFAAALSFSVHWSHTARTARQMAEEDRARHAEEERRKHEEEWRRQQELDMYQLSLDFKRQRAQLELEQMRARADEELRTARRASRVQAPVQLHTEPAVHPSSDSAERDAQKAAIAQALAQNPACNKTALAAQIGVSRRTLYNLINELKAEGKL
jgi:hypothetical protein